MDDYESLKPQQTGVQISCGLHSQVPQENAVRAVEAASRRGVPQIGNAEGVQGRRGAFDAGSCSHDDFDPAEICGVASNRVHQGQERYPPGASLWKITVTVHSIGITARLAKRLNRLDMPC